MKMRKEWKLMLLAILASASLLPACGKSSGSNTPVGSGGVAVSGASVSGVSGGISYTLNGSAVAVGYSGMSAQMAIGGQGGGGQLQYFRTDGPGDQIQVALNGSSITGYVYLSPLTLQTLGNCSLSNAYVVIQNAASVNAYQSSQYGSSNLLGTFALVTMCGTLQM